MRLEPCLAGLALIFSLGATPALAAVCLHQSMTSDEIIDTINAASGCERARKIFTDCQQGTGGDSGPGAAVEKKCERDFLGSLERPQKLLYRRELRVCNRKYRDKEGTMYVSFTAMCRADVAQRYSRRALKAAR